MVTSVKAHGQASVLLLANLDQILEHHFKLMESMEDAHSGAVLPPGNRDTCNIQDAPIPVPAGELNPAHSGLVFPGAKLEKPDLSAFLMDGSIPQEVRERVQVAVDMAHADNVVKMRAMDQKVRALYTTASALVNDSSEALNGYRKMLSALDVWQ